MHINLVDPKDLGGGKLDARAQTYLEGNGRDIPFPWSVSIDYLRADSSARNKALMTPYPAPVLASVRQITLPGPEGSLQARVYTPPGNGPFPLLVNFHGGGWILGGLDDYESAYHILSTGAGQVLLSVDYRLAPEHCFPAAVEDCYAAYLWARTKTDLLNIDTTRTSVIGDSAGGNLAAAVSLMCRDREMPLPEYQILIYPAVSITDMSWSSYEQFSEYGLSREEVAWCWKQYAPEREDWHNPYLSPFLADDLTNLPPALVITAEFDTLRDEGEAYAQKLEKAGVPVACSRYLGMLHGFALMPGYYDEAQLALEEIIEFLS